MKNKEQWHNTLEEKYGDRNYNLFGSKSFKEKLKEKYGVEYNTQIPEVKEKIRQTNLKKYGVECNLQLFSGHEHSKKIWNEQGDKIREKIKNTSLIKYGTESPNQSEEVKRKQKESLINHYGNLENAYKHKVKQNKKTKLEKYGDENYHNKEKMSKTLLERHIKFENENNCIRYNKIVEEYGQGWKSLNLPIIYNGRFRYISKKYLEIIRKYSEETHNLKASSKQENDLLNFIKTCTNYRIYKNIKNIIKDEHKKYELDIYIPRLHIAFEYNGTYWHSDLYKDKYYHQLKTKLCYEQGIQLIHIYDFDWINNKELIKKHIIELFQGKDCSQYNWVSIDKYNDYILSDPELIQIKNDKRIFNVYNEGKFIKK